MCRALYCACHGPEMKIHIRKRNVEVTKILRAHVESRLGLALGRFGERIGRVIVRFSDTDGHRSGLDKRCQIDVGLRPRSVRVEDMDVDLFVAVDNATDRVSRSVARALEREREWDEGSSDSRI
jgi:putative sigma-54 modulation protein